MHPKQIKSEFQENGGWVFLHSEPLLSVENGKGKRSSKSSRNRVRDPSNISDFPMFPTGNLLATQVSVGFPKINKAKYL